MAISYLEQEANAKRAQEIVRNDYSTNDEYSENHKDTLSDGDPLGKGTGLAQKAPTRPHENPSKTSYDYAIDTQNGGGSYDIDGRNGISGRNVNLLHNIYNKDNEYPGGLSVDESIPGQYVVK